jgi:hypothetical protein
MKNGCMLLSIDIEERIISVWSKLCDNDGVNVNNKLSILVYNNLLRSTAVLSDNLLKKKYPWFFNVKTILIKCGLSQMWFDIIICKLEWLKLSVQQKLKDLFK